jgi:hypothetical protein
LAGLNTLRLHKLFYRCGEFVRHLMLPVLANTSAIDDFH